MNKGWYKLEIRLLKKPVFTGWKQVTITSIKFGVGDGGDQIWGNHADWGNARFTCANSNGRQAVEEEKIDWFWVSPNPNDGKFTAKIILKES